MLYLPSSSCIIIRALLELRRVTSLGSEVKSIMSLKASLSSSKLSSFIRTLSEAVVIPGVNVAVYGPGV